MPEPTADTDRRSDLTITGVPGGWTIRSRDGRRRSDPLDDATARHYCQLLGVEFPDDRS